MIHKITKNEIVIAFAQAVSRFFTYSTIFIVLTVMWWTLYPYKTADIVEPVKVMNLNNKVRKSDKLRLRLIVNKQTTVTPTVSRNMACDTGTFLVPIPSTGGVARPVGKSEAISSYLIPEDIPINSNCVFVFSNSYQVNALRVINKEWRSEEFKVIK